MSEFKFNSAWLAAEHNRLHNIELWPDGKRKQRALRAVQSTLDGLSRHSGTTQNFTCFLCQSKRTNLKVMEPRGGMSLGGDFSDTVPLENSVQSEMARNASR